MTLSVGVPPGFRFRSVVLSHGWADLPPFRFDHAHERLTLTLPWGRRSYGFVDISPARGALRVVTSGPAGRLPAFRRGAESVARSVFRLDEDLRPFYRALAPHPKHSWIRRLGAGRLLRAPTAFEDAVKMICTTNCSWALTKAMTGRLCEALGRGPSGARSFPTPGEMAARGEKFYRERIRCGYRAPFLASLSRRVARGSLDIERWRDTGFPAEELRAEMASVDGIGPYAAGNLLKLAGRYGDLGIDSWCRKQYAELHREGRRVGDAAIEHHYRGYGEWRGLFFWLDLTQGWYRKSYTEIFGS